MRRRAKLWQLSIRVFIAALFLTNCAQPLVAGEKVVDLGGRGALALQVPEGWIMERREDAGAPFMTLTFGPEVGDEFSVLLTPISPEPGADPDFGSPASVYSVVEAAARDAQVYAAEENLEIREFEGGKVGYYFWATKRELAGMSRIPPGEYLYVTQGAVMVGELLCAFTIRTNARPSGIIDAGMLMLRTAAHRTGA